MSYFNYRVRIAETAWERREFVSNWWRIYAADSRWIPPYYPTLRWALNPGRNSHLARLHPILAYIEALPRRHNPLRAQSEQSLIEPASFEVPLAAAAVLLDRRRVDKTAYLSLFHSDNDLEGMERLLEHFAELGRANGYSRFICPTGLSPYLGSGCLQDHWNLFPPWQTPYNPPYLPELMETLFTPIARSHLYHLTLPADWPEPHAPRADLSPLSPERLAGDLLPLFAAACSNRMGFAPPDAAEVAFLLAWLGRPTLMGQLACVDGQPVGFVLLQPDWSRCLRLARGGRGWLGRLWWLALRRLPQLHGRLLFGAVLPGWRRQGIGRQLLRQALVMAREQGWQSINIGPLAEESEAVSMLQQIEARPCQTYKLYEWVF